MGSVDDGVEVDFKLVTTYLPVLSLIFRALTLLGLLELAVLGGVGAAAMVAGTSAFVYWDAHVHRNERLSVVCGGLLPVAGAMLTTRVLVRYAGAHAMPPCTGWEAFLLAWVFDVAWAVASSFYLVAAVIQPSYTHRFLPVLWSVLAVAKIWGLCEPVMIYEVPMRATLFYVTSMLFLYAAPFLPAVDRNVHRMVTPHLSLHLLVVQPYVLFASMLVFSLVLTRVFTSGAKLWTKELHPPHTPVLPKFVSTPERVRTTALPADDGGLLEQLRLAKAQAQPV